MLDASLQTMDERLVASLRADEARRRRRRLLIGGVLMLTICTAVVAIVLSQSRPADSADRTRAAGLAQEGWKLWQQRDMVAAQKKFEEATQLDPGRADHWNGLGWASYQGGDAEAGAKAFAKAIELQRDHPAARNGLGYLNFGERKYKEAEQHWLIAIKNPNATAPFYGMAKMYLLTGQFDKAGEFVAKAQKEDPADATLKRMASAATAKKLSPELRKEIEPAAPGAGGAWGKQSPESARGWQQFARTRYDEAQASFEAALKKNPKELPAHNGLGFVLLNTGHTEEARKHFEICLKADPKAGGPLNGLARCYKNEGKLDQAIATWEKMVSGTPGVNAGTYGLAEAYLEKGEYAKSVKLYEQLVQADPKNEELRESLDRAKRAMSQPEN